MFFTGETDFKGEDICTILFEIEETGYTPIPEETNLESVMDESEQLGNLKLYDIHNR